MIQIKGVAYYKDAQDGSGHFTFYNNLEELQADLEISDEKLQEILDDEDPYENGEIDKSFTIEIEEVDGKYRLANSFTVHWGS